MMSPELRSSYENSVQERLEESLYEYMDDDMIHKLAPAIKKFLGAELASRRKQVADLEAVINQLFSEADKA